MTWRHGPRVGCDYSVIIDSSDGTLVKTMTLTQFLTEEQIAEAIHLYKTRGCFAVSHIMARVIEPNMAAINAKLGQENDPRDLAYAVEYMLTHALYNKESA